MNRENRRKGGLSINKNICENVIKQSTIFIIKQLLEFALKYYFNICIG